MSTPSWIPSTISENRLLSPFTTLEVGGVGQVVAIVRTLEELKETLAFYRLFKSYLELCVIGKGSNLLLGDGLTDGVIEAFFLVNQIQGIVFEGEKVVVGAGVNVSYLAQKVAKLGFGGLEFFSGIPGSVGGVVAMNAGAQNRETKEALLGVVTLDLEGNRHEYRTEECAFGYRDSIFKRKKEIIIEATFALVRDPQAEEKRKAILSKRLLTQPFTASTAGCMFKNPEGHSAGALIDACGLKGLQIGGVKVSEKHANFFENIENGTAANVLALVEAVRYAVKNKTGIDLELEVIPCFTTYSPMQPFLEDL